MKVGEIEDKILQTALELANAKAQEEFQIPDAPFVAGGQRSEGSGPFVLEISHEHYSMLNNARKAGFGTEESILGEYRRIAAEAVQEAIIQHGDEFGALIATFALRGEDYFDAFN
jgi:hypothetical protein